MIRNILFEKVCSSAHKISLHLVNWGEYTFLYKTSTGRLIAFYHQNCVGVRARINKSEKKILDSWMSDFSALVKKNTFVAEDIQSLLPEELKIYA